MISYLLIWLIDKNWLRIYILLIIMAEHVYNSSFKFSTLTVMSKDDYRKAKHIITHIV